MWPVNRLGPNTTPGPAVLHGTKLPWRGWHASNGTGRAQRVPAGQAPPRAQSQHPARATARGMRCGDTHRNPLVLGSGGCSPAPHQPRKPPRGRGWGRAKKEITQTTPTQLAIYPPERNPKNFWAAATVSAGQGLHGCRMAVQAFGSRRTGVQKGSQNQSNTCSSMRVLMYG